MNAQDDPVTTYLALTGRVATVTRQPDGVCIVFEAGPELRASLNNDEVLLPEKSVTVSEDTQAAMHAALQAWLDFHKEKEYADKS